MATAHLCPDLVRVSLDKFCLNVCCRSCVHTSLECFQFINLVKHVCATYINVCAYVFDLQTVFCLPETCICHVFHSHVLVGGGGLAGSSIRKHIQTQILNAFQLFSKYSDVLDFCGITHSTYFAFNFPLQDLVLSSISTFVFNFSQSATNSFWNHFLCLTCSLRFLEHPKNAQINFLGAVNF
jgi:hypothetical protein